jgi:hypothetical protein
MSCGAALGSATRSTTFASSTMVIHRTPQRCSRMDNSTATTNAVPESPESREAVQPETQTTPVLWRHDIPHLLFQLERQLTLPQ